MYTAHRRNLEDAMANLVELVGAGEVLDSVVRAMSTNELDEMVDWLYDQYDVYDWDEDDDEFDDGDDE